MRIAWLLACASVCVGAQEPGRAVLPSVTVTATARDPVEKSYRKMLRGMDLFERQHGMSPDASLRFKLLPRRHDTDINNVVLEVVGTTVERPVPIAADHTFTLTRIQRALDEDAVVTPNRKAMSMTWRTEIRTPGLAPDTRRLGDLRLECQVGIEAGLVSNVRSIIGAIASLFSDARSYCDKPDARYLFFSDRPLFSVALSAGTRREVLPVSKLYAGASEDAAVNDDLAYCDCEVLLDRTYFLPLGDHSWPDDTLIEFDYMDGAGADAGDKRTKSEVLAAFGQATTIKFDSGFEVWVYRDKRSQDAPRAAAERVILFGPSGVVQKIRVRPPHG